MIIHWMEYHLVLGHPCGLRYQEHIGNTIEECIPKFRPRKFLLYKIYTDISAAVSRSPQCIFCIIIFFLCQNSGIHSFIILCPTITNSLSKYIGNSKVNIKTMVKVIHTIQGECYTCICSKAEINTKRRCSQGIRYIANDNGHVLHMHVDVVSEDGAENEAEQKEKEIRHCHIQTRVPHACNYPVCTQYCWCAESNIMIHHAYTSCGCDRVNACGLSI